MADKNSSTTFTKLLKGSIYIFAGNLFGTAAAFATRLTAARYLGPDQYGILIVGLTIVNIGALITLLGLPKGLAREIPRSARPGRIFSNSIATSLFTSISLAILIVISAEQLSRLLNIPGGQLVLIMFAFALPFRVLFNLSLGGLRGLEAAKTRTLVQNFTNQGLTAILVIVGSVLGFALVEVASAWLIAYAVSAAIALIFLRKKLDLNFDPLRWKYQLLPKVAESRELILFSIPLMFAQGLWLLIQQSDNIILAYFINSSSVGIYDSAFTVAKLLLLFIWGPTFLFLPMFSRLQSEGKKEKMVRLYRRTTKAMGFCTAPVLAFTFVFSDDLLSFLFGSEYAGGDVALMILLMGFSIHVFAGLTQEGLTAFGLTTHIMIGNFVGLIANLILNFVLIPTHGFIGAAIASATTLIAVNSFWIYMLYTESGIHPMYQRYYIPLLASIITSMATFYLVKNHLPESPIFLAGTFIIYLPIHVSVIYVFGGFSKKEKGWLKDQSGLDM